MKTFTAEVATEQVYGLAEGPLWDAERQRVLWVDINVGHVHTGHLSDGRVVPHDRLDFDGTVGAVAVATSGALVVAGPKGLVRVDPDGTRHPGPEVVRADRASRLNDGACDPAGRFLVGSMALDDREHEEVLVRVEDDTVTVLDDDLSLSNGLAWSPDGQVLYSVDTKPGVVGRRSYATDGSVGPRTEAFRVADGSPDGMCADADGNLWVAVFGAGQVRCYSPAGEHLATVEVPAPNTSCPAFVGPALDTLLVATASEQLSPGQRAAHPDSGRLFAADVGVRGLPPTPWAGR